MLDWKREDSMPGMDHGSSEQAADVNDADVMFASMMIVTTSRPSR
jgi:hypothetical protein